MQTSYRDGDDDKDKDGRSTIPHTDLDAWDWRRRDRGVCVPPGLAEGCVFLLDKEDGNLL